MASSVFNLAAVAAKVTTIGAVRAAMGAVTLTLSQGYAQLDQISTIAGEKDAARSLLDTVNKSAQILYGIYNDDPDLQDEDISTGHAVSAAHIIYEANDALKSIEQAAGENLWDIATIVDNALSLIGAKVGSTIQGVTNAVAAGATAFAFAAWPTLLLLAAAGAIYVYRGPILKALAKGAA